MTRNAHSHADRAHREAALDTRGSFLVQAPAGSGKTSLLVERTLRLLAEADEPEQVLAITFTKAAAAHMRARVLDALANARRLQRGETLASERDEELARAALPALQRELERGWDLEKHPQRLPIQTLDALAYDIARSAALDSQLPPGISPVEDAAPLFAMAARRTVRRLGEESALGDALRSQLRRNDNQLGAFAKEIAELLSSRAFWRHLLGTDATNLRASLEAELAQAVSAACDAAEESLAVIDTPLRVEIVALAREAGDGAHNELIARCSRLLSWPAVTPANLFLWRGLSEFLDTGDAIRTNPPQNVGLQPARRPQLRAVYAVLKQLPGLHDALKRISAIPRPEYSAAAWQHVQEILTILRHALIELREVFLAEGQMDFDELTISAQRALDAGFTLDHVRHIMVDEFQDTSVTQARMIASILRGLPQDARCTLFLVGDPMQGIYGFRRAEVLLFQRACHEWRDGVRVLPLQLSVNFRSQQALVDAVNPVFSAVFQQQSEVDFHQATAHRPAEAVLPFNIHPQLRSDSTDDDEAADVVALIEQIREREPQASIAILLRAAGHAAPILPLLRQRNLRYLAVGLETLGNRQEVRDLRSLAAALQHPADRLAWLGCLRAPWCGLTRRSLDLLCEPDSASHNPECFSRSLPSRVARLTAQEAERATRTLQIITTAARRAGRSTLSTLLDETWRELRGPETLNPEQRANAAAFFRLLEQRENEGLPLHDAALASAVGELSAVSDPLADDTLQVMTIHKAKGLEFHYVIVPGLDKTTQRETGSLLNWVAQSLSPETLLMAGSAGVDATEEEKLLCEWIAAERKRRTRAENARLFYVAVTRAMRAVHLFGSYTIRKDGNLGTPDADSLLRTAWPALENAFVGDSSRRSEASRTLQKPVPATIDRLAAEADEEEHATVCRLPIVQFPAPPTPAAAQDAPAERPSFEQHPLAAARGEVTHLLLDQLARERARGNDLSAWLARIPAVAGTLLRQHGLRPDAIAAEARKVSAMVTTVATSPTGAWIFTAHPQANSELTIGSLRESRLQTLRLDRVFLACATPLSAGTTHRWIVDIKTADSGDGELFLAEQAEKYRGQLRRYSNAAQALFTDGLPLRLALYFPALDRLVELSVD